MQQQTHIRENSVEKQIRETFLSWNAHAIQENATSCDYKRRSLGPD
jgi:hypothetical protein